MNFFYSSTSQAYSFSSSFFLQRNTEQDLFNIFGSMYTAVIFLGINNCSTVLPYVATERTILYRERFAGMYSSKAYSFAQVQHCYQLKLFSLLIMRKKLVGLHFKYNNGIQLCWMSFNIGLHRNTLHTRANNFVRGHYISNNRLHLVCLQGFLVLLCIILYVSIFCIPWDADSFFEHKPWSSFDLGSGNLYSVKSFLRLSHARPGKWFPTLILIAKSRNWILG